MKITRLVARQILDSRGNPTIEVELFAGSKMVRAAVPSGASTGAYEAVELRDNGSRYMGKGVSLAVKNCLKIGKRITGMDPQDQAAIDELMISMDGTENKSKLGANAILAVSMAVTRLAAVRNGLPLYAQLGRMAGKKPVMPVPFANVINGGRHAGTDLRMQEFMLCAKGAKSFSDAVEATSVTYHHLKAITEKRYGKTATNVGDEGGFAPPIAKADDAFRLIEAAISKAGYSDIIKVAIDCAASEFYNKNGLYLLHRQFTRKSLAAYYHDLIRKYDVISIEDPFDQDDFEGFSSFTRSTRIQVVGDDLLVSNPDRIATAVKEKRCNALLLKVNQIGTVTEALQAAKLARNAGWAVMVSHRSGETEDTFISDLAVGLGTGQIKLGAPCRGERTAKYNQLLRIEEGLGKAKYGF